MKSILYKKNLQTLPRNFNSWRKIETCDFGKSVFLTHIIFFFKKKATFYHKNVFFLV